MSTTTVTRIAVRFAQILTLALLLVGLAGGTRLARAAYDVDCEEAAPWIEETLDRFEVIEDYHQEFLKVYTFEQVLALSYHGIGLYEDVAREQAESNPPEELEGLNDDLAEAYAAVALALADIHDAVADLDNKEGFEALDRYHAAGLEVGDAMIYVERLAEDCEDEARRGGDRRDDDHKNEDEETVEIEIEATVLDVESDEPIEDAAFIILKEGVDFEDFDQRAFFRDGDEDQVLAVGYSDRDGEISVEAEIEIDGEYTVIVAHEDYEFLKYWVDVPFATDDDAETYEFGTVTLGAEPEDEED